MVLGPMFKLIGPCINEVRSSVSVLDIKAQMLVLDSVRAVLYL